MQTVVLKRVTQSLRNHFLAGNLLKGLRPPFSCYHLIRHFSKDKGLQRKDKARSVRLLVAERKSYAFPGDIIKTPGIAFAGTVAFNTAEIDDDGILTLNLRDIRATGNPKRLKPREM